jgi:peptidyl-prolyl cis-trans isomerase SurA
MQAKVQSSATEMTPKEIKAFYEKTSKDSLPIISTQYQLSQIVRYPDREKAKIQVREQLLGFRERILKGENFAMLARFYSEDPGSANKGGELGMASKAIFWPAFSDAAMALKEGQVSPIVETPDGFHIIQMIKKEGDMFNPFWSMLKAGYGTLAYQDAWNIFDNIVVSENLVNAKGGKLRLQKGTDPKFYGNIYRASFLFQQSGQYKGYPLRTFVGNDFQGGYSDHLPVYIFIGK